MVLKEEARERELFLDIEVFKKFQGVNPHFYFQLTDPNNLQFLKVLEINEHEFQALKHEQSLRVEFQQFPEKFQELLKLCQESNCEEKMQFGCILSVANNASTFKIVEHNEFKSLDHLTLQFQQPKDDVVKNYLADCLLDLLQSQAENEQRLEQMQM